MKNTLVSIIIPVYNGSNYLREAIDSALTQTYKNIEILVVNDGSDDNGATEKIVRSYGNKVRYFKKTNGGVSSALNLGIKNMKGEYFSWLSHDDLYEPNKIEKQVSLIETSKDIIICSGKLVDSNKKPIPYARKALEGRFSGIQLFDKFLHGHGLNGLGFLIPKSVFDKVGYFDESMRYLQDVDLWLRIMAEDVVFVCHRDKLVMSRIHKNQTSNLKSNLYDVDRENLAIKHLNMTDRMPEEKRNAFLKRYYCLFIKDNTVPGIRLAKQKLNDLNCNSVKESVTVLYYRAASVLKKIKRNIVHFVLLLKGERS